MKYISNRVKTGLLAAVSAMTILSSCNKDLEQFPATTPTDPTGQALGEKLAATPTDSLYYRLIIKAGMTATLNTRSTYYTMFVPDNAAMRPFLTAASGGAVPLGSPDAAYSAFITNNFPATSAVGVVSYYTCPQVITTANIPASFPNFQYPSILNPAPALSALLRLSVFPSTANGAWLNNFPITSVNSSAANGVIHHIAAVNAPPSQYLWDRINTDVTPGTGLTYLKAAIIRADSGTGTPGTLQSALLNIGANLTVFAPTDAVMQGTLTALITQALIAQGVPPATAAAQAAVLAGTPAVFSNPLLYGTLSATTVKGIVVYHMLGTRAFTNNFFTTQANVPTLLNGGVPAHPGVGLKATFTAGQVSAATVKGLMNASASNVILNPLPNGSSDQLYLNGVLHKIDQMLLPQ